eukprot:1897508-Rhodomonas_salina.1
MDDAGNLHYVGEFAFGVPHGQGKKYTANGFVEGEWLAGTLACEKGGLLVYTDPNGGSSVEYAG